MPVKNEAFIVIEESLTTRLQNSWARHITSTLAQIANKASVGDFSAAYKLVSTIDLTPPIQKNEQFLAVSGMSAALFGASRFAPVQKTSFATQDKPPILDNSVNVISRVLTENGSEIVRRTANKLLNIEERRQSEDIVVKSEKLIFTRDFIFTTKKSGDDMLSLASNLHTSRLAAWGFTVEATVRGQKYYQVSEVLDSIICPVCRTMHGKVFAVPQARNKLERWLDVEDPDDLKSLAPWPKQNKKSVENLQAMSDGDILASGWDTPPYHPKCYSDTMRVYTRKGFQLFRDVSVGDEFLSLNPDSLQLEWIVAVAKQEYAYEGLMVRYSNKQGSVGLLVTPDHSQFVRRRVDKGTHREMVSKFVPACEAFTSPENKLFLSSEHVGVAHETIQGYRAEPFARFMGWYLSEGHTTHRTKNHYESCITQFKHPLDVSATLEDCGIPYTKHKGGKFYLRDQELNKWLYKFGKSFEKYIPAIIMESSVGLLRAFLQTYLLGDGSTTTNRCFGYKSTSKVIFTTSIRMRDQLVEVSIRCGGSGSFRVSSLKGMSTKHNNGTYTSNHDCWAVSLNTTIHRNPEVSHEDYRGLVYDVTLERNHTLLVELDGSIAWSGNCRGILVPTTKVPAPTSGVVAQDEPQLIGLSSKDVATLLIGGAAALVTSNSPDPEEEGLGALGVVLGVALDQQLNEE